MSQEYIITESQVNKILKYVTTKPYNEVIEIINFIQSDIVPSPVPELLAKIKELETERDQRAEEYKELLKPIQEAIKSKLSE